MDVDNMSGSTLEAMAKAVEGSEVVLICVSKKYKESQVRCRCPDALTTVTEMDR